MDWEEGGKDLRKALGGRLRNEDSAHRPSFLNRNSNFPRPPAPRGRFNTALPWKFPFLKILYARMAQMLKISI